LLLAPDLGLPEDAVSFSGGHPRGDSANWRADTSRLQGIGFSPRHVEAGAPAYATWARQELQIGVR
jgi:hypothetical protein